MLMKKSLLKILQHPLENHNGRSDDAAAAAATAPENPTHCPAAHQQFILQTMEKEMSFKYAISTNGGKRKVAPFKFSIYRPDGKRSLILQDEFQQIAQRSKRFSSIIGDKSKPTDRFYLLENKSIHICLLTDLLLMGTASSRDLADVKGKYCWQMLHDPIPLRDVELTAMPDIGNLRYVVELKVGTGALYSLCAPTKECRTAWIEEIRRLKEALEPPTIQRRPSVIVRPLANRQTSVSSAFVTASAAVSQPTSAPVKLPAEFDELSKFPCKVYYWNNDDPSNLHWVPMGHATLELKIETEVKSQVLIYAVPYTGRPMFGATLTPHFTFNVASEDPVEINPIKLLMRINMQLAKFNGEQFDGKCRMVSVKIKGQDRVRRWSKLVKALMAAAGELNNDNDDIADDVDEKEEEDEDVSNSSCISHKDSDVEASYWSASASGSSNSSISADENAFESASQRNIDLNTDEMPAKQSIDKQSAKFEGLEQVSCEARRNIARINEEIKQLFSSKEILSLPADCEASADKLKEENLAVMGMGGQSTDDENDSPDDDSLSQTSFAGFQLIESDGEDLDEPLLPPRLDSLPVSNSEIKVSVGYWIDRMLDASETTEQQLRQEISRLHELIRQLASA